MERWLPSKEFSNYEISDAGNIRNATTGRILKQSITARGYKQVCLHDNKKQYTRKVARMVGDTFLEKESDDLDITYRDGDKLNCRADNLEYCTRKELINRTYENGREQTHKMKRVRCVETGEVYNSIRECSESTGINRSSISRSVNGCCISIKEGYHFEFTE